MCWNWKWHNQCLCTSGNAPSSNTSHGRNAHLTEWLTPHMKTERRGSWLRKTFRFGCFTCASRKVKTQISVRALWVFHPHKYDTNCETTHEEGIVTLNRLVLVLGKLSRRLAAFMATAFTSSFPSHKAPTYWSLTPLQGCETTQHSDSTSLDPHQFDHLVRWSECWYRRAVLLCAILVAPACCEGCGGPLFGIDSTAVNPSRNLRNHDVTVVFI